MTNGKFSTYLLDRVLSGRRHSREVLRTEVLQSLKLALCESPIPINEAIIFGSLIGQRSFYPDSDIDLAVHTLDPRDYFSLKTYLEGRLRRNVDLIEIEACRFHAAIMSKGVRWTKKAI